MMKERLLQDVKIAIFGILAVVLIVLTVLELMPQGGLGLEIKEAVRVSSASLSPFDAEVRDYQTSVTGMLSNPTDATVKVESIRVRIAFGDNTREVAIGGFEMPARTTREFSQTFEGQTPYDRVSEVGVTVGGVEELLLNSTESRSTVSGVAVFYVALLALFLYLLVRAVKGRYYLYQESTQE